MRLTPYPRLRLPQYGRKFRTAMELGEWFRRQSAKTRGSVLEHVSVVGGGNPMQMAIRGGSAAALGTLIDAAWKDAGVEAAKTLTKVRCGVGWE